MALDPNDPDLAAILDSDDDLGSQEEALSQAGGGRSSTERTLSQSGGPSLSQALGSPGGHSSQAVGGRSSAPSVNLEDSQLFSAESEDTHRRIAQRRPKSRKRPKESRGLEPKRRCLPSELQSSDEEEGGSSSQLTEMKSLILQVCKKVEDNTKLLKDLQTVSPIDNSSDSSGQSSRSKTDKKTLKAIRKEVRSVYKTLCDSTENSFEGWNLSPGQSIKSKENSAVVDTLVKEIKAHNSRFATSDIRGAAHRYYKSKSEQESNSRRGLEEEKRRRERKIRKRKERECVIQKNTKLPPESKEKWLKVMCTDMMSSEDSSDEGSNTVRPLPWRSVWDWVKDNR